MTQGVRRSTLFALERLLVRGPQYRFLVVVALIGVVSAAGGMLLIAGGAEEPPLEAMWWAFLRLSDPGYLGDDEGLWRRSLSTLLTVLGYVIFLGAMVAILTQWLNDTLNRLERGLTPIRANGHIVILGWTNRTREICRELAVSEGRLSRWLELRGVRRLQVAILASKIGPERDQELREQLGTRYKRNRFILRSGDPLRPATLSRVDVANAGGVVLPGGEATSDRADRHDATVIKILRSIAARHDNGQPLPPCVCEVVDPRLISVARRAYGGPLDVIASDVVIGRMLGESLLQPGLSRVFTELVSHGVGATLYVRTWDEANTTLGALRDRTANAVLVGLVRSSAFTLGTRSDLGVERGDAVIYVAHSHDETAPRSELIEAQRVPVELRESAPLVAGRVLIIGWSRRVPDVLAELESVRGSTWHVDVFSASELEQRTADLESHNVSLHNVALHQHVGDSTIPSALAATDPASYDRILLVASDWLDTGEDSDARTLTSYLGLRTLLEGSKRQPTLLIELTDAANESMFEAGATEVVSSPLLLSRALAQAVLRREVLPVFDDVFGTGDCELSFLGLDAKGPLTFTEAAGGALAHEAVAVGLRRRSGELLLAPDSAESFDHQRGDELVVLRRARESTGTDASTVGVP